MLCKGFLLPTDMFPHFMQSDLLLILHLLISFSFMVLKSQCEHDMCFVAVWMGHCCSHLYASRKMNTEKLQFATTCASWYQHWVTCTARA